MTYMSDAFDLGPEVRDLLGLVGDDVRLERHGVVLTIAQGLEGVGGHVQGLGVGPGEEPPEGRLRVGADDVHD